MTVAFICLDDEYLDWTEQGQLKPIYDGFRRREYRYGGDTLLNSVLLPCGKAIGYEYGTGLMPVLVTEDGDLVAEYEWEDLLRLARYIDIRNGLLYSFSYGRARASLTVTVTGEPGAVRTGTGVTTDLLTLGIGIDQVGSIRELATPGEGR